jgi:hypothetical protein
VLQFYMYSSLGFFEPASVVVETKYFYFVVQVLVGFKPEGLLVLGSKQSNPKLLVTSEDLRPNANVQSC